MEKKTGVAIITIGTVVFGAIATAMGCYVQQQILEQSRAQTTLITKNLELISKPYNQV